jgi:phosphopantothenoylcysteine decarboxylase / phosphopantothenate---cysteine ligase
MLEACREPFATADIGIFAAAVADYRPASQADRKIKRENTDTMTISLVKNPDIASTLASEKRDSQIFVGFALETDHEYENALGKLKRKNLDMIVLNSLQDKGAGFGTDTNKITIVGNDGIEKSFPLKEKRAVAGDIIDEITARLY